MLSTTLTIFACLNCLRRPQCCHSICLPAQVLLYCTRCSSSTHLCSKQCYLHTVSSVSNVSNGIIQSAYPPHLLLVMRSTTLFSYVLQYYLHVVSVSLTARSQQPCTIHHQLCAYALQLPSLHTCTLHRPHIYLFHVSLLCTCLCAITFPW